MASLYYQNNKLCNINTVLVSTFERKGVNYVRFENDIYYPQGGGQKGDRGVIFIGEKEYKVINTIKDENEGVLSVTEELIPEEYLNSEVQCVLDWEFRYKQMKLHTCLHLHHCMLEKIIGEELEYPITAAIEDGFAFNKYSGNILDNMIIEEANSLFFKLIKSQEQVITYPDAEKAGYRWWECMGYKIPCGGIHVSSLNEIDNVVIKVSFKKGHVTIKFILTEV